MEQANPFGFIFKANTRYEYIKPLGQGAYGYVCSAVDKQTNQNVAIKRISSLNNPVILLRTLREIQLLKHFKNKDNIITILNSFLPESGDFTEIFIIQECMEADLHFIIQSKQCLTTEHVRFLLFQLINGLKTIHLAGVIHRDLKPSNCLVNSRCVLKICDFGLARENCDDNSEMSNYVQTRWYRAPELLFKFTKYNDRVDMWSVGCIFMELLTRVPFLPGISEQDQLFKIFDTFGTAPMNLINNIPNRVIKSNVMSLEIKVKRRPDEVFMGMEEETCDLLDNLFHYDCERRISAVDALQHNYFKNHCINKVSIGKYICAYNEFACVKDMKIMLYNEIFDLHKSELIEKTIKFDNNLVDPK